MEDGRSRLDSAHAAGYLGGVDVEQKYTLEQRESPSVLLFNRLYTSTKAPIA